MILSARSQTCECLSCTTPILPTSSLTVSVRNMPDLEKSLDGQPPAVVDMSNPLGPKESSPDDVDSSERATETAEKESGGSMRDYFVRG